MMLRLIFASLLLFLPLIRIAAVEQQRVATASEQLFNALFTNLFNAQSLPTQSSPQANPSRHNHNDNDAFPDMKNPEMRNHQYLPDNPTVLQLGKTQDFMVVPDARISTGVRQQRKATNAKDAASVLRPSSGQESKRAVKTRNIGRPVYGQKCSQPQRIGSGPYRIPRWYYNGVRRRCELFYFSGCCGNGNNFVSYKSCQSTCAPKFCSLSACCLPMSAPFGPYCIRQTLWDAALVKGVCRVYHCRPECLRYLCPELLQSAFSCSTTPIFHPTTTLPTQTTTPDQTNVCYLPKDRGFGDGSITTRYYYNRQSGRCERFGYYGYGGNGNNFRSVIECISACSFFRPTIPPTMEPGAPNPCAFGSPFQSGSGPQRCSSTSTSAAASTSSASACPANYYCHVGAAVATTICCPKGRKLPITTPPGYTNAARTHNNNSAAAPPPSAPLVLVAAGDRCTQPLRPGAGGEQLARHYFDPLSQQCRPFLYLGLQGNENNFLSNADCDRSCFVNPCAEGLPLRRQGSVVECGPESDSVCPSSGFYCHVGATARTSVCCPSSDTNTDVCRLDLRHGLGDADLLRWYYDPGMKQCAQFIYGGFKGNENNFLSMAQCRDKCDVTLSTCKVTTESRFKKDCLKANDCPLDHWCHIGSSPLTTICCPNNTPSETPCTARAKSVGVGDETLTRWSYDRSTNRCFPFVYRGRQGNQNNFLNRQNCEHQCKVAANPCLRGEPVLRPDTKERMRCGPFQPCLGNNYCQIGASATTTVCCPKMGDACKQSLMVGKGPFALDRWHFDQSVGICRPFRYYGMKGNQNNFLSQANCRDTCRENVSPCANSSKTLSDLSGCFHDGTCGASKWCHIGESPETTVCCDGMVSPCAVPKVTGIGIARLSRYYFDNRAKQCLPFTYNGLKGNPNNFLNKEACEAACPTWINPCPFGEPFLERGRNTPRVCHSETSCPDSYWCHIGATNRQTCCCPQASDPCQTAQSIGEGSYSLNRWYYDANKRGCSPFLYRGLKGNPNNFLSEQACRNRCPTWVNPCATGQPILDENTQLPVQCEAVRSRDDSCPQSHWCHVGVSAETTVCCPGRSALPCAMPRSNGDVVGGRTDLSGVLRWYFDGAKRQCVRFNYGGLKGNQNNFLSQSSCEDICPVFEDPCPSSGFSFSQDVSLQAQIIRCTFQNPNSCPANHWCHIGASEDTTVCCVNDGDPCTLRQSVGTGQVSLARFYFDQRLKQCLPFRYLGTKGNQNNFLTKEACEATCPVFVNPCAGALIMEGELPRQCSRTFPCPDGAFCHIGDTRDTTVCCRADGQNPCRQPLASGTGTANLRRWYYNSVGRACTPFIYRGLKGNQNNFLSQQDCDRTCYEFDNPCAAGDPAPDNSQLPSRRPLECGRDVAICTNQYWCHRGGSQEQTVCCPGAAASNRQICQLEQQQGEGEFALPRWYYDYRQDRCVQFSYRGKFGNQNNFLSERECRVTCPVNACPTGDPLSDPGTGRPRTCSVQSCPSGRWCHLGGVDAHTMCCQGQVRAPATCEQFPMEAGQGDFQLTRWYYDSTSGQCRVFTYRGLKGNQNNFESEQQCRRICNVLNDPCPIPTSNGRPQQCAAGVTGGGCPVGQWCHVGESPPMTVCCSGAGDPCRQPRVEGLGEASLRRFYYQQQTGGCLPFTYRGTKGNQNNFASQAACELRCGPNPCTQGMPFTGVDGAPQTCSTVGGQSNCPTTFWCHVGASARTSVCCPAALTGRALCALPQIAGEGDASLERYWYNDVTGQCERFSYRGLKGNQNSFLSLRDCQVGCYQFENPCIGQAAQTPSGQIIFCSSTNVDNCPVNFWCHIGRGPQTTVCCPGATNPCSVPLAPGTGTSNEQRWYYNVDERRCISFTYNGIRGNQNNFQTKSECDATCPAELCTLSIDTGACSQRLSRYAYDRQIGRCRRFEYSGCGGNLNNFASLAECQNTCSNIGFKAR